MPNRNPCFEQLKCYWSGGQGSGRQLERQSNLSPRWMITQIQNSAYRPTPFKFFSPIWKPWIDKANRETLWCKSKVRKCVSQSGVAQHYRFRFEAENRFCLAGYGATVLMLFVVYWFQVEPINFENWFIYTCITMGFHGFVQMIGVAGLLASKRRNYFVSQIAMVNWAVSFTYGCFFVSELRPILLLGSFLTKNFDN